MAELNAVELVDLNDIETKTEEKQIILKHEFDWFLTDEFKELREGFEPTDNSEFVKEYCKNTILVWKKKYPLGIHTLVINVRRLIMEPLFIKPTH